jgi:uncharacterized protein (TIGR02246 family)
MQMRIASRRAEATSILVRYGASIGSSVVKAVVWSYAIFLVGYVSLKIIDVICNPYEIEIGTALVFLLYLVTIGWMVGARSPSGAKSTERNPVVSSARRILSAPSSADAEETLSRDRRSQRLDQFARLYSLAIWPMVFITTVLCIATFSDEIYPKTQMTFGGGRTYAASFVLNDSMQVSPTRAIRELPAFIVDEDAIFFLLVACVREDSVPTSVFLPVHRVFSATLLMDEQAKPPTTMPSLALSSNSCRELARYLPNAVQAIDHANAKFTDAITRGDSAGLVANYADDAVVMNSGEPAWCGRGEIGAGFAKWIQSAKFSDIKDSTASVDVAGDYAIETGHFEMTVTPKGGKAMTGKNKYLRVWKKQADGSWKVYRDISNSDGPPQKSSGPVALGR